MFAAYALAMPQKAQAFLKRMDTGLQEKLSQATLTYVPGSIPCMFFCLGLSLSARAWNPGSGSVMLYVDIH